MTQLAEEYKITSKMGKLIEKKPNTTHTPGQTMRTIFKGVLQNIQIYHFQLRKAKAHISTYYRDLRRCDEESYHKAKQIMEEFYLKARKKKKVAITIDGTFIGVRGRKYEKAHKMYSGNRKDKGKVGYTIVTCVDSTNKLPISFEVPTIHEIHVFPTLIEEAIKLEEEEAIIIKSVVLDALYLNKEILALLSEHKFKFIIRAPSHEWLVKYSDDDVEKGSKKIELWGHKVVL